MSIPMSYVWTAGAVLLFAAALLAPGWGFPPHGGGGNAASLAGTLNLPAEEADRADEPAPLFVAQAPKKDSPTEPTKAAKKEPPAATDSAAQYATIHFASESEAAKRIFEEFSKPTEMKFKETPLKDVVTAITEGHKINIVINHKKLEDAGLNAEDTLVTRNLSKVSLRSGLRLILEPLGLDYVIKHEVLMITSKDDADQHLNARVYDIRQLRSVEPDALMKVIQKTVKPETWSQQGGPGTIESLPGCLVISQTQGVHDEIVELFTLLERHARAPQ